MPDWFQVTRETKRADLPEWLKRCVDLTYANRWFVARVGIRAVACAFDCCLVKLPEPVGIVVMAPDEFENWLGVHPVTREKALTEVEGEARQPGPQDAPQTTPTNKGNTNEE